MPLTRDDIRKMAREVSVWVQENQRRLKTCEGPRHIFVALNDRPILDRYKCQICQGEVDHTAYHWYLQGLEHAMKGSK